MNETIIRKEQSRPYFMLINQVSLFASFLIAYYLKFGNCNISQKWKLYILIVEMINFVIFILSDSYYYILQKRYYWELINTFKQILYLLLIGSAVAFVLKAGKLYSREVTVIMLLIYYNLSILGKYVLKRFLISKKIVNIQKKELFIIGELKTIDQTVKNIMSGDYKYYVISGIFMIDVKELRINNRIISEDYISYILSNNIFEVLVATAPSNISSQTYNLLLENGIAIHFLFNKVFPFQPENITINNVGLDECISVANFSFSQNQKSYLFLKRLMDIVFGSIGIIVLIPISILVKIINIFSGDYDPLFFKQERIGLNGKRILIWKYRTMIPNAEKELNTILRNDLWRKEWEQNKKIRDDPRVTTTGRFLRKTSLDEFPQFINVLKGQMSLVGPRPLIDGELEEHNGLKIYQMVKPGMTGWWACNGRSNITYRERLDFEYYYVKNISFYLDLLCVFRTIYMVVRKRGAY